MNPRVLKSLSYAGVTFVMIVSFLYTYKTYEAGAPKWNFMILGFGIAILLGINLIKRRRY
jgi:hypothetical protein